MQTILQAAAAYYVVNRQWPDSITQTDLLPYLPFDKATVNPWGNSYSGDPQGTKKERFQVRTTVPDTNIAKRIIGNLPNAQLIGANAVAAEINIPGQAPNHEEIIIKDMGYKVNGNGILMPQCPTDFLPKLFLSLAYLRASVNVSHSIGQPPTRIALEYTTGTTGTGNPLWTIKATLRQVESCNILTRQCKEKDQPYGETWGDGHPVDIGVFYITACCPANSPPSMCSP